MKHVFHNNKGLTLVEIIATVALIGIVFVGVMSVFPQMSLFNEKTFTKLDTMNLARQEISEMKALSFTGTPVEIRQQLITDPVMAYLPNPAFNETNASGETIHYFEKTKGTYRYELRFYETPKFSGEAALGKLYQVHLTVKTDQAFNSETFGYIEAK